MNRWDLVAGLISCTALAAVAWVVGAAVPVVGVPVSAILLGLLMGPLCRRQPRLGPGVRFAGEHVLSAMIVVLGFTLDMGGLADAGPSMLAWVVVVTTLAVGLGVVGARALGLSRGIGLLIGLGCAICGTAAIAAASPLVKEDDGDPGIAVGVIHALGLVMLLLVPALATLLGLGDTSTGVLIGGTLPALGHVVAAGFSLGDAVGDVATAVKIGRIGLLLPALGILAMALRKPGAWPVPWGVLGFVLTAIVAATGVLPKAALQGVDGLADVLLAIAMVGIGAGIDLTKLKGAAPRALALGTGILSVQVLLFAMWCLLVL